MSAPHWLYRPGSVRRLAVAGAIVLALSVAAELLAHVHPAFAFDAWFGFSAVYGFVACVAMVLFARLLGWLVKRPDTYYDNGGRNRGSGVSDGDHAAHGQSIAAPAAPTVTPRRRRRGGRRRG